jgi:hypothetical protein
VISEKFLSFIKNDKTYLEREPLEKVTKLKQLSAYRHNSFWQCIDNMRDLIYDKSGRYYLKPLDYALKSGNPNICALIMQHGAECTSGVLSMPKFADTFEQAEQINSPKSAHTKVADHEATTTTTRHQDQESSRRSSPSTDRGFHP